MFIGNVILWLCMIVVGVFVLVVGVCVFVLVQDMVSDILVQFDMFWYEFFFFNQDVGLLLVLEEILIIDWFVNDWFGIMLGICEDLGCFMDVDDFSVGVIYDLNGCICFGGQFCFMMLIDELFMMDEMDELELEIKFELLVCF